MDGCMIAIFGLVFWACFKLIKSMFSVIAKDIEALSAPRRAKEADERMRRKVNICVEQHIDVLVRKRSQMVQTDDYGNVRAQPWLDEIVYFLNNNILPMLDDAERAAFVKDGNNVATTLIEGAVSDAQAVRAGEVAYTDTMSPIDYEHFCGALLAQVGWSTRVTKASGDQGVDVVAEKAGKRLVIQCKKYSSPVGNGAVQEVHSAKLFERAGYAAVVSNAGYTRSAKELAHATSVHLLHHMDLPHIDRLLALDARAAEFVAGVTEQGHGRPRAPGRRR